MYVIPIDNQLSYTSIPRNRDLNLTIDNHCDFPSRVLVVDRSGNCFVCACEAWLPITVGNILDFTQLKDVWDNPVARSLQADIDQKRFTHCAVDRCGIINNDQSSAHYCGKPDIKDIYYISINIDDSCNLRCPSCRPDLVMNTAGELFDQRLHMVNHLVDLLQHFDQPVHIVMSGNGDPLASNIMRPLLHRWQPKNNQTIRLFTNGLLLDKQLTDNPIVNSISQYFISIDAGSEMIYEHVRQPGKWSNLLRNFDWLADTVKNHGSHVLLKFVLQNANYTDMENFVQLCARYKFAGVINRLEDWGTWANYAEHDVIGNTAHANHNQAVAELRRVYSLYRDQVQFNSSLESIARE